MRSELIRLLREAQSQLSAGAKDARARNITRLTPRVEDVSALANEADRMLFDWSLVEAIEAQLGSSPGTKPE